MLKPVLALLSVVSFTAFGQQLSHPVMASRDDLSYAPRPLLTQPDTLRVLAVMVQFAADSDPGTTGDGRFNLSAASEPIIDSPPRNGQFFRDHLTFLENYYRKASDLKQIIEATLVDTVYTLTDEMGAYSPQRGESNLKLAELVRDTWMMVDASNRVSRFSDYDCFLIFHAGTGRDIDLVSILGFDPTPRDIPSLFLGRAGLKQEFGASYPGIVVNDGQDTIWNSAILPETENRLIPTISGDVLLELGLNGLICASVASYLGLPDLFDTNTGLSAIGRFGLMDGQAIFSFLGIFPPEPSAWEKYWLGWVEPSVIAAGETWIEMPAVGFSTADTSYRLPITAGEYFLLENRYRDPDEDGQSVTYTFNGVTTTRRFVRDTVGFNSFDISALSGVVTDVEDLDWSIPGGVDVDGNNLPGGVLVWHIDEAVIQRGIRTNSINGDPDLRGVDVEEADGSQDIGQQYGFLSPGSGSEEGTPLDLWYDGNPVPVYQNEFSFSTFPSSRSNSGAQSHITVRDFSAALPRMSAIVMIGTSDVSLLPGFPRSIGESLTNPSVTVGSIAATGIPAILTTSTGLGIPQYVLEGDSVVVPPGAGKVYGWNTDGTQAMPGSFSDGRFIRGMDPQGDAFLSTSGSIRDLNGDGVPEVIIGQGKSTGGASSSSLRAFSAVDADGDSLADLFFSASLTAVPSTPPLILDSLIIVGTEGGTAYLTRFDGSVKDSVVLTNGSEIVTGLSRLPLPDGFTVAGSEGTLLVVSGGIQTERSFISPLAGPAAAGMFGAANDLLRIAVTTADGFLHVMDSQLNDLPGFPVSLGSAIINPPALADVDADGSRDFVAFGGSSVFAFNIAGSLVDNFPVRTGNDPVTSAPVIADIDGDGDLDVLAVSEGGLVVAYDRSGESAAGFPLQAGTGLQSAAVLTITSPSQSTIDLALVVASAGDGSVTAWRTGTIPSNAEQQLLPWPQFQRDPSKSGYSETVLSGAPVSSSFFPADRVYNWPNPVYENTTYIRFFVGSDADVRITVFDLAGELVDEFGMRASGGVDNEFAWDVSSVGSGIYFARVEALGGGASGNAVVKVAVVK